MRVLSWHGKHDVRLYDASTPELLEASARLIIKDLLDAGWIHNPGEYEPREGHVEAVNAYRELVAAEVKLPETVMNTMKQAAAQAERAERHHREAQEEYAEAVALAAGEVVYVLRWTPARHTPKEWAQRIEENRAIHGDAMKIDDRGLSFPTTAWAFLQGRSGYEYEGYHLDTVVNPLDS